jgi:hypothetical protein
VLGNVPDFTALFHINVIVKSDLDLYKIFYKESDVFEIVGFL